MGFEIERLGDPQARRVWCDYRDIPDATKALLEQCAKEEITPNVVLFETVEDKWAIIVWGD